MSDLAGKVYQSVQNADEVRVFERWHASSIAECPRSHYYKRLAVPRLSYVGAGKMLRWKAGHLYEEALRPHLEEVFDDLQSNERLVSDTLNLTGEYDNYSRKEQMIIEVKTVHDFAMQYRRKGDDRFKLKSDEPYLNHELQNHAYVLLLREKGELVKSISYLYTTLDGRIATYETPVKPELLAEVEGRLKVLNTAWERQQPPECICEESHRLWKPVMQYCDYREGDQCCSLGLINKQANEPEWSEAK